MALFIPHFKFYMVHRNIRIFIGHCCWPAKFHVYVFCHLGGKKKFYALSTKKNWCPEYRAYLCTSCSTTVFHARAAPRPNSALVLIALPVSRNLLAKMRHISPLITKRDVYIYAHKHTPALAQHNHALTWVWSLESRVEQSSKREHLDL
jgi:hypothetical protein